MARRAYMLAVICLAVMLSGAQAAQSSKADETSIRQIVKQLEDGWNAHDGKAFAAPFAADADYVVVNGMKLKGHDEIEKGHTAIFSNIYKESRNAATIKSVRFLRPDVAVVHVEWNLEFTVGGQTNKARAMNSLVVTKEGGKWSIAAFHNTPIQAEGH